MRASTRCCTFENSASERPTRLGAIPILGNMIPNLGMVNPLALPSGHRPQAHASGQAAAGAIHTDFERGFIRAETIAYDDYVKDGGRRARATRQAAARRQGLRGRRWRRDPFPVCDVAVFP